ncbi:hypothetical protein RRG08_039873 [Elysia crispata]|uniref:Uncharacterized protein n=1 Tax=Elysia crispata TaxID=231223 RepID=A0AAE0ZVF9_9GAST|nr:hypothetical protein RRG08_039873 [Elysia crispata]
MLLVKEIRRNRKKFGCQGNSTKFNLVQVSFLPKVEKWLHLFPRVAEELEKGDKCGRRKRKKVGQRYRGFKLLGDRKLTARH